MKISQVSRYFENTKEVDLPIRTGTGSCDYFGNKYKGEFENWKPHGLGELLNSKLYYKGRFMNGLPDGFGRACFESGDKYVGQFQRGRMHGEGVYFFSPHSKSKAIMHNGFFAKGLPNGHGILTFLDGTRYEGHFSNGRYEGYGELKCPSSWVYKGEFKQGVPYGKGVLTFMSRVVLKDPHFSGYFFGNSCSIL